MSSSKKLIQAASGVGGAGLDVDEVFSTYLYEGNSSTQTITNDIDLSGEGGLIWLKNRDASGAANIHGFFDTERGTSARLDSSSTDAEASQSGVTSFNSNGFAIGNSGSFNRSSEGIVSWTWRKAPKWFDIVTYTGNSTAGRTVSHNLGSTPGMIIVKRTDAIRAWYVFHRSVGSTKYLSLNETDAAITSSSYWNDTDPTSTQFTLGSQAGVNASGGTYVAYLFAHNNSDGEFGPDSDADIIKCGSYTGTGASGHFINVGFEPQWLLIKNTGASESWIIQDNMRSMTDTDYAWLYANGSNNEAGGSLSGGASAARPTGFEINLTGANINASGNNYIYMAIRRGPLAEPTSATDVFNVLKETTATLNQSPPYLQQTGFPVDVVSNKSFGGGSSWWTATRLTNARLQLQQTNAETSVSTTHEFDHNDGVAVNGLSGSTNFMGYHFRRAPGFFDVVTYTGNGSHPQTINHNLGVVPEMIWHKTRSGYSSGDWHIYHKDTYTNGGSFTESSGTAAFGAAYNNINSTPTATTIDVKNISYDSEASNYSGYNYIMYLFATLAGISKVGSFVADGNAQNIDCGFSSGARFVLIKKSSGTFDWRVWDSSRGIVAGDDPYLFLNSTAASTTNGDWIDPHSSGFSITSAFSNGTYIFYAIA